MPLFTKSGKASASTASRSTRGEQPSASPNLPLPLDTALDGAASLHDSDYALKSRQIMELYRALLDLHASTVFDLPRVAVIGKQSSGKSSLVEAVTGINVPRDSGTCTRCPMVCTMSSMARSWSCRISLRRIYDQNGKALANPTVEPFGGVIEDPSEVELQIRRAQAATLSPHRAPSDFYAMSKEELSANASSDKLALDFSKNEVQVEVMDPNATDLTFVDLPGLIQNHTNHHLISLVGELTKDYIRKKNTLIVITMPMADDIQNMEAVTLAKDAGADPRKERTIGVITKPDDLSQGSTGLREAWKAILEGRQIEHATKHGYYCVRLPDDDQRKAKMSRAEAEHFASDWFATNTPWSGMEDRSRLGVPNFVKDISQLLIELIERNLPKLKKTVEEELAKCAKDLGNLPPELDLKDPSTEVMLRISDFCKDIKDAVFGKKHQYFVQLNKEHYRRFKTDIQMTTPDFRPVEDAASSQYTVVHSHCQPRGLAEVRNVIRGSITWELPGHVPFEATKSLVIQYTSLWKDPSSRCFQDVVSQTDDLLNRLLFDHFGRFSKLENYMRQLTSKDREMRKQEALVALEKLLCREIDPLFTQNVETFETEKITWSNKYRQYPHPGWERSSRNSPDPWFPAPARIPVAHRFPRKMFPHIPDGGNSSHAEIEVMVNVQAYFQIAYKRIIDYVPLTMEHELNQAFAQAIDKTLFAAISKDTQSGDVSYDDLLSEDPLIKAKRNELKERKGRLLKIKEKLDTFQQVATSRLGLSADDDDEILEIADWSEEHEQALDTASLRSHGSLGAPTRSPSPSRRASLDSSVLAPTAPVIYSISRTPM